jgi:predicted nucleotidyltransferase
MATGLSAWFCLGRARGDARKDSDYDVAALVDDARFG